jgi:hypothetical protein
LAYATIKPAIKPKKPTIIAPVQVEYEGAAVD